MTTLDNTLDDYAEIIINIKKQTVIVERLLTDRKFTDAFSMMGKLDASVFSLTKWFERNIK